MWKKEMTAERKITFARLAQQFERRQVTEEGLFHSAGEWWGGSICSRGVTWAWTPIWLLSKGSKLLLFVFFHQAPNKSCQKELIRELVSEITQTTENAHEPQCNESYPRLWLLNITRKEEEDFPAKIALWTQKGSAGRGKGFSKPT